MAQYIGQLGHIGVGKESSWGAGAGPSLFIAELLEADLQPVVGFDYPAQVAGVLAQRRVRMGATVVRGALSFDVSAGGALPLFLLSCFGTVTTTLVNTVGGNVWQHYFTLANTSAVIERPSLCIEHNHGGLYARRYRGCRVGRMRLALANHDTAALSARVELIGKDEVSSGPAAANFNADDALPFTGFAAAFDANANTRVRDFEVEFATGLEEIATAGSGTSPGRLPAGQFDVSGNADLVLETTERRYDYLNGLTRALHFGVTGATIVSNWAYQVQVDVWQAHLSERQERLAAGILNEGFDFRGLWDVSSGIARVVVTNTTSGY
jgi:hypothetical protein